ncbi:MAG: hypothetical protein J6W65_04895, partial [Oscillospiraceae bacterium]|nr:hypothetical protein [Oscillospiraceae bacterium]
MKEQLPLKRIFIGLVASVTAGVAVTAAGAVDNTVLVRPEKASSHSYIVKSEAAADNTYSAEASVVALNHEETNNSITKLTDLTTVSSSAFKAEAEEAVLPAVTETTAAEESQGEYEAEEWWKAGLSDYNENLEKEDLVPTTTAVEAADPEETDNEADESEDEGDEQIAEQYSSDPTVIREASDCSQSGVSVGAAEIRLPSELSPNTVFFTSYGYG